MVMLLNQSPLYQSYLEQKCSGQSFFLKSGGGAGTDGGGAGTGYLIIASCIMFLISHYSTLRILTAIFPCTF